MGAEFTEFGREPAGQKLNLRIRYFFCVLTQDFKHVLLLYIDFKGREN